MIDEKTFNKIAGIVFLALLVFLTFIILRPILLSAIFGLILAFVFYPVYKRVLVIIKNKNLASLIICILVLSMVIVPVLLLTPVVIRQSLEAYNHLRGEDVLAPLKDLITRAISSPELANDLIGAVNSFTDKIASALSSKLTEIIFNSPTIILQIALILFVFFFGLRDGDQLVAYMQSLSPLSKESEKKVFRQFKDITSSVIYGQILAGIAQGVVTGVALFIFGVPNALVLTIIATFVGVLPIIGPWLVWIPIDIYLFLQGKTLSGIGLLIYGLVVISWVDTVIRPLVVSRKTKINSGVVLVSMVGGLFVFGILGLILGPLIIAYLILFLDSYRDQRVESVLIVEEKEKV